ncbi:MAG: methionine aminotransferase [Sinomicrobium sp.]|nr:methionine aminotransferase [Sinomicrobium sp.]
MIRSKLPDIPVTIFTVMSKMAADHNALNLSQGFPNFKGDQKLIDLVSEAMNVGYNQYAPMQGDRELREVIARKLNTLYNSHYDPETDITVTAGATQAIFTAISAVVHPGDEVIVLKPAYDCYEPAVELCGGIPVPLQLKAPEYAIAWDKVRCSITQKTRLIIINTPHNPSGAVLSETDMLQLQALVEGTDIMVLSDEVYEHIIFDGRLHQSAARFPKLAERSFITASFGKTFHNTGWKTGYCAGPKAMMQEFNKVHQFNVFSVNHPMQKALAAYLKTPEHYRGLGDFYQRKRDLFLSLIKDSRFSFIPSAGTYFQLLDYSRITQENDMAFAERLVKEHKIAAIPASVFNKDKEDHKMLRFCFAKTDDTLKKAAAILNTI